MCPTYNQMLKVIIIHYQFRKLFLKMHSSKNDSQYPHFYQSVTDLQKIVNSQRKKETQKQIQKETEWQSSQVTGLSVW